MDAKSKELIDIAENNGKLLEIILDEFTETKAENANLRKELTDQSLRHQEALNQRLNEVASLREAIKEHKESFDDDEVTTEEDARLWQILEES